MLRYLFAKRWTTQVYDRRDTAICLEWTKDVDNVYHTEFKPFLDSKEAFHLADKWTRQATKVGFLNSTNSLYQRIPVKDTGWYSYAQSGNNLARQKYYSQGLVPPPCTISIRKNVEYDLAVRHTEYAQFKVLWEFHYVSETNASVGVRLENI
jgi:hypothetical protein